MVASARRRFAQANAFLAAAFGYWLEIFPEVAREVRRWRRTARAIPDPWLRELALQTQAQERGNLEGAAAFAVLVPRSHRRAVTRAAVAFQALYDYIDTLAEQPVPDPVAHGRVLHLALLAALDARRPHADYYAHCPTGQDGGYALSLIERCRAALATLPSYSAVRPAALTATRRMVDYQALNHAHEPDHAALRAWALELTPAESGLRWWETAAGAASSLAVFALIAAAADPAVTPEQASAMEGAYFPWIGALHVLLDSLVDLDADLDSGDHSLVEHYGCPQEAAHRLAGIAERALGATGQVAQGARHATILAAMTSFYLSRPGALVPGALPATELVLATLGSLAMPAMAVLKVRNTLGRIAGARGSSAAPIQGHPVT